MTQLKLQLTLLESHDKLKWVQDVSGFYTRQLIPEVGTKVFLEYHIVICCCKILCCVMILIKLVHRTHHCAYVDWIENLLHTLKQLLDYGNVHTAFVCIFVNHDDFCHLSLVFVRLLVFFRLTFADFCCLSSTFAVLGRQWLRAGLPCMHCIPDQPCTPSVQGHPSTTLPLATPRK